MNTSFQKNKNYKSHQIVDKRVANIPSKKTYTRPVLYVEIIELENSFAAGSATLFPGNASNVNTPNIEDWTNQGSIGNQDIDL